MTVLRLFESMHCAHVPGLDAASVRAQLRDLAKVRAWIDSREADLAARLVELSPDSSASVAVIDVQANGRLTKQQTRKLMDRAETVQQLPEFADALRQGKVTSAHVDEIGHALRKAGDGAQELKSHEGALLLSAMRLPHDQFARQVAGLLQRLHTSSANDEADRQRRSTYLKTWTDANGMIHIRGAFDTERGTILLGRLENEMERAFHAGSSVDEGDLLGVAPNDNRRSLALLNLTANGHSEGTHAGTSGGTHAEIVVIVDLETLRNGLHDSGTCRTSRGVDLPVDTVRRLACQASIIPAVMNSAGVPVDVGRQNRLATARQRRLLQAMYRTCAVPECDVGIAHCVPHHIQYWENGGRTDLDNLVPLCSRHHHAAHEGGWKLRLDPTRTLHVTLPDGRVMSRDLQRAGGPVTA